MLVVALAGNIVTGLAKGLRKKYSPYASASLSAIFEKFKEKKLNVVTSLREASDAIFTTVSMRREEEGGREYEEEEEGGREYEEGGRQC